MQDLVHSHRRQRLVAHRVRPREHRSPSPSPEAGPPTGPRTSGILRTTLAAATLVGVLIYLPIEVYTSWKLGALLRFAFLIDLVGIGLLSAGGLGVWRNRPVGPGLLVAGWAWTSANFWRATMERYATVAQGGTLYAGEIELWLGPGVTGVAMLALGASLRLALRAARA